MSRLQAWNAVCSDIVVVTYATTCTEDVCWFVFIPNMLPVAGLDPGSGMNLLDITSKDWWQKALDVSG